MEINLNSSISQIFLFAQFILPIVIYVFVKNLSNVLKAIRLAVPVFWFLLVCASFFAVSENTFYILYFNIILAVAIIARAFYLRKHGQQMFLTKKEAGGKRAAAEETAEEEEGYIRKGEGEPACVDLTFSSKHSWTDSKDGKFKPNFLSYLLGSVQGLYFLDIGYIVYKKSQLEYKIDIESDVWGFYWTAYSSITEIYASGETEFAKVNCDDKCEPVGVGEEVDEVDPESGARTIVKFEPLTKDANRLPVKMTMIAALPASLGGDVRIEKTTVSYTSPQTPLGQVGISTEVSITGRTADKLEKKFSPYFDCHASEGGSAIH